MLMDIAASRASVSGAGHLTVGEARFVTALALIQLEEPARAAEELDAAAATFSPGDVDRARLLDMARIMLNALA